MKLFFGIGEVPEGFERVAPETVFHADSVDEVQGIGVLETTPDLFRFMNDLHFMMKSGAKATLIAPYYAAAEAYNNPFAIRGISEQSLNWTSKTWRELNKVTYNTNTDFEVTIGLTFDEALKLRAEEVQVHWRTHFLNVIKIVHFILVKK